MGNTCKTCINNDDGLCDRRGILVEDEDSCEHHWALRRRPKMKKHEKKMDITPQLMISAYNTLIQGCSAEASRPVRMEPAAAASCTSTAQVHQIFFRKTGRRYIIRIWKETHCIT